MNWMSGLTDGLARGKEEERGTGWINEWLDGLKIDR